MTTAAVIGAVEVNTETAVVVRQSRANDGGELVSLPASL